MLSITRRAIPLFAAAGLLSLAAVGSAGLASAQIAHPVTDDVFMSQLEATGIPMLSRDEAIRFAHSGCDALAGGADTIGVAAATSDFTVLTMDEAKVFVRVAVEAYCPQYMNEFD